MIKKELLNIQNLTVSINNKTILNNFNFKINENEIHVLMGPNGSGKSTLSKVITGHPDYFIKSGIITFKNKNLLDMKPEIRAHEGIFLAFQYPFEIHGVTNYDFLRLAYNEKAKYLEMPELNPLEFMSFVTLKLSQLKISQEFLDRDVNQGFSGGEKKKNEILQLLLLKPDLIILDELDSGLDIDAIKIIFEAINKYKEPNSSILIITHYPKIIDYLKPDYIHILRHGNIIKTGNIELISIIERDGYQNIL